MDGGCNGGIVGWGGCMVEDHVGMNWCIEAYGGLEPVFVTLGMAVLYNDEYMLHTVVATFAMLE